MECCKLTVHNLTI